jgi:ABC-2 type transport system permease protein
MSTLVTDTSIVLGRELRPMVRDPFSVVFGLIQPLIFLGLFGPLLSQVSGLDDGALQWFVPGIVVMSALYATSMTGSNLQMEMQTGSHERLLVAPLTRSSLLVGRALKEIVPVLVQTVVIIAVVLPFGFRVEPAGVLIGMAIVAVFGVGLGSLSHALAIASKGQDWIFWTVQQTVLFPLLLLSGMLLPIEGGPGWMQALSKGNPLTYIVDAERALFDGDLTDVVVLQGAISAAAVCAVGLAVGIRAIRSGTR